MTPSPPAQAEASETVEPLPCPFCGTVPTDIEEYHGHYHNIPTFYVNCMACDIAVYGQGREGAIARWNTRPAQSERDSRGRRIAELEAALEPFAKAAAKTRGLGLADDAYMLHYVCDGERADITEMDLRKAKRALTPGEKS